MKAKAKEESTNRILRIAKDVERARLMSEVENFSAVPLDHPGLARAFQVGGAPVGCVWVVHGPTGSGKTLLIARLMRCFQAHDAVPVYVDAEMIADVRVWFSKLGVDGEKCLYIGRQKKDEERGKALSYEQTVSSIDKVIANYQANRDGKPLLIAVDSIDRLVPEAFIEAMEKDGGDALRSGVGRTKANMNAAWLRGLGPRVCDDDIAFIVIAHEGENKGAKPWEKAWYVKGGGELLFEAGVQVRVNFAGLVKERVGGKEDVEVGKRHRITVIKNKMGRCNEKTYLFTSNGVGLAPAGFDVPRELVTEALSLGVLEGPGEQTDLTPAARLVLGDKKFRLRDCYGDNAAELEKGLRDAIGK